jgi:hypothetical protein
MSNSIGGKGTGTMSYTKENEKKIESKENEIINKK